MCNDCISATCCSACVTSSIADPPTELLLTDLAAVGATPSAVCTYVRPRPHCGPRLRALPARSARCSGRRTKPIQPTSSAPAGQPPGNCSEHLSRLACSSTGQGMKSSSAFFASGPGCQRPSSEVWLFSGASMLNSLTSCDPNNFAVYDLEAALAPGLMTSLSVCASAGKATSKRSPASTVRGRADSCCNNSRLREVAGAATKV